MSAVGGPNIVNDGLVLALDAANIKSFRGEPTTNNAGTGNIYTNWNNSGTATWINNDTSVNRPYSEVQVNSMYKDTAGNSHIAVGNGTIDGTTWTFSVSVYIPSSAGMLAGSVPYFRSFPANTSRGALTYNGSSDWNSWPKDTWIRIERTWTNTAGDTSAYISCYLDTAGNKIYLSAPQLENKAYSTPFVNGTRGTTVTTGGGWADRSGKSNHGELVNGPTYNSSNLGSLSFDGVDDQITIPFNASTMDFSLAQTIIMWMKPGTNATTARRNPYNQAYGGSGTITHEPSSAFNYYFGTHGGNNTPYTGVGSSFTVVPNELAFIAVTRSQSLNICRWYKNGVRFVNTSAGGYASTNNGSSPIIIANGYTNEFIGDIYYTLVYNRFFTDDEILQVYNATKGRFGL